MKAFKKLLSISILMIIFGAYYFRPHHTAPPEEMANQAGDCEPYQRNQYMPDGSWADQDGDCQNTRVEILARDNQDGRSNDCKIKKGTWHDLYTNTDFHLASKVQIDHLVPLSEAHRSGAWAWSKARKTEFANSLDGPPYELLAVDGPTNQSKSDDDPAHWLPPNKAYHKAYVKNWLAIKVRWELSMDDAEANAIRAILGKDTSGVQWPRVEAEKNCRQ